MFSCVISHWYILKSLSFSRFQIPCFHLFVCILSTIHSFFIGTNENFHVSWSFNIITGTFRAFRLFVCVYAFAIIVVCWYLYSMSSFNVYHSVLSALRLGWLLTQPTHQTTPLYSLSTLTIAISQRRIVRKIYYAYKFPTSFVFSLANANGNLDGVFFSCLLLRFLRLLGTSFIWHLVKFYRATDSHLKWSLHVDIYAIAFVRCIMFAAFPFFFRRIL